MRALLVVGCTTILFAAACPAETAELRQLFEDTGALDALAEAQAETCDICAADRLKKTFDRLNKRLVPGRVFTTSQECLLEKTEWIGANELQATCFPGSGTGDGYPLLTFRFHTAAGRLAGISEADLTERRPALEYGSHPRGLFRGAIQIVRFTYGDGDGFHYSPGSHHLQIHCRLLNLEYLPPAIPAQP